jgi:hypothetical protein
MSKYFINNLNINYMKKLFAIVMLMAIGTGLVSLTSCTKDDTTAPDITLNGDATMYIDLATVFTDPGATANDDEDGDLTANITSTGTVNVNEVGLYVITYSVADEAGNTSEVTRDVYVRANLLEGNYHVTDVVTGTSAGTYTYDIEVDPSSNVTTGWQTLIINNFGGFGAPVNVTCTINGGVITIPEQQPSGMAAGWEAKITGSGTYDGATRSLKTFTYKAKYLNTANGEDNGVATLSDKF